MSSSIHYTIVHKFKFFSRLDIVPFLSPILAIISHIILDISLHILYRLCYLL